MVIPEDKKRPAESIRPGMLEDLQLIQRTPAVDQQLSNRYVTVIIGGVKLPIGVFEAGGSLSLKQELETHRQNFLEHIERHKPSNAEGEDELLGVQKRRQIFQQIVDTLDVIIAQL